MVIFHCYVSSPEGITYDQSDPFQNLTHRGHPSHPRPPVLIQVIAASQAIAEEVMQNLRLLPFGWDPETIQDWLMMLFNSD